MGDIDIDALVTALALGSGIICVSAYARHCLKHGSELRSAFAVVLAGAGVVGGAFIVLCALVPSLIPNLKYWVVYLAAGGIAAIIHSAGVIRRSFAEATRREVGAERPSPEALSSLTVKEAVPHLQSLPLERLAELREYELKRDSPRKTLLTEIDRVVAVKERQ